MPRKANNPYRRPRSPYWWCYFYDRDGNLCRESTKCTDHKAAKLWLQHKQSQRADPNHSSKDQASETLDTALEFLLKAKRSSRRAEGTITMYRQKAAHLVRILGRERQIHTLVHDDLQNFIDKRTEEGADPSTIKKELVTASQALKCAVARQIPRVPSPRAIVPEYHFRYTPKETRLTEGEFSKIFAKLATKPHRQLWLAVACYIGGRLSEIQNLDWADVDLGNGWIRIRGTKTGRADRPVPIVAALGKLLLAVPLEDRKGRVVEKWGEVGRDLSRAARQVGIDKKISPNDLRRTFASWLKQRGVESKVVADLLGHSTTAMVDRVYGHLTNKNLRAAVDLLGNVAPDSTVSTLAEVATKKA